MASFGLHFEPIWSSILAHFGPLGAPWAVLGAPWLALGARGFAETILGAKSWFVGPPWVPENDHKMGAKIDEKTFEHLYDFLGDF